MLLTMSLRVASVMIGCSPSAGCGGVRAPVSLSTCAMSAVTRPCRTALSIALNAGSACRWMSISSRMCRSAPYAPMSMIPSPPTLPTHTFASKNQKER